FPPGFYRAGGPRTGGVRGPFLGPAAEGLEEGDGRPPMRLFLAMLSHETNTFSNVPTDRGQFEARHPRSGATLIPSVAASASPAGRVTRDIYEHVKQRMLADLKSAGRLDGVLLDLH